MPSDGDGARLQPVLLGMVGGSLTGKPLAAQGQRRSMRIVDSQEPALVVTVLGPVEKGGHAAVAGVRVEDGGPVVLGDRFAPPEAAVRVEFADDEGEELLRRVAMIKAAELSRTMTDRYPALLRVRQTFRTQLPDGIGAHQNRSVVCDVAEWCSPLERLIRTECKNGMAPDQAIGLWLPLATTMDLLHQDFGWVHRDIDESNVLVAREGALRLADFGIVSVVDDGQTHHSTTFYGKDFNVPPEGRRAGLARQRLAARGSYDAWQLGRLLYVLLTGDPAKVGLFTDGGAVVIDPTKYWNRWNDIKDPALRDIVRALVDEDPDERLSLTNAIEQIGRWQRAQRRASPDDETAAQRRIDIQHVDETVHECAKLMVLLQGEGAPGLLREATILRHDATSIRDQLKAGRDLPRPIPPFPGVTVMPAEIAELESRVRELQRQARQRAVFGPVTADGPGNGPVHHPAVRTVSGRDWARCIGIAILAIVEAIVLGGGLAFGLAAQTTSGWEKVLGAWAAAAVFLWGPLALLAVGMWEGQWETDLGWSGRFSDWTKASTIRFSDAWWARRGAPILVLILVALLAGLTVWASR